MMKSKELSLYLKGKIPPNEIRNCIYKSLNDELKQKESLEGSMVPVISDQGHKRTVTALQFLKL